MEKEKLSPLVYTKMQISALTFLRVLIGWHFLYEGLVKLYSPGGWTSEFFLSNSVGPFSFALKSIAANHSLLYWVDLANVWGLILIGTCGDTGHSITVPVLHSLSPFCLLCRFHTG
jgi:thiosulfate dehydrogenase [quinone] large subunit